MTGRYRITFADPGRGRLAERLTAKRWSIFVHTCESLAADGLNYSVTFALGAVDPHILITASGTARAKRKPAALPRHGMVQPVKAEDCRTRASEAAWFLPENAAKRNGNTTYWRRRYARYNDLAAMAVDELRAEVEFWRELELLSGQRQHFKPGLTDENRFEDDEVAA